DRVSGRLRASHHDRAVLRDQRPCRHGLGADPVEAEHLGEAGRIGAGPHVYVPAPARDPRAQRAERAGMATADRTAHIRHTALDVTSSRIERSGYADVLMRRVESRGYVDCTGAPISERRETSAGR